MLKNKLNKMQIEIKKNKKFKLTMKKIKKKNKKFKNKIIRIQILKKKKINNNNHKISNK